MRRPRGPGGRFLTADEVSAIEKGEGGDLQKYAVNLPKNEAKSPADTKTPQTGSKRKSGVDHEETSAKRARNNPKKTSSPSEDDEEDDEDDADDDD